MRRITLLSVAVSLFAFAAPLAAQTHTTTGVALDTPPAFDSNRLGRTRFEVTTRNAEARRLFLQGLALCYAFNHDEAVRSFQRALDHDPDCTMAHWGIALASGPNVNLPMDDAHEKTALAEIRLAQAGAARISAHEQALIAALAMRYAEPIGVARGARDSAYADAMRAVVKSYPDDPDALALTAEALLDLSPWRWWTNDGQPIGATPEAITLVRHGLSIDSLHTGLNHLLIHAIEESPNPGDATPAARRLAALAPDAGHLVHMPSHIWGRLGRYQEAALLNVRAAHIDSLYIAKYHVEGVYPLMYLNHNLDFASNAYFMEGRLRDAVRIAAPMAANAEAMASQMAMIDAFAARVLAIRAGCRDWDAVLATPEPSPAVPVTRAIRRVVRGMAYAASGRTAQAQTELDSLDAALHTMPADAAAGLTPAADLFAVARTQLAGCLARARQDLTTAEHELRNATTRYESLPYDEPEDWILSPRIELGGVLLAKHAPSEAEAIFRAELHHHPNSGRALYGLMLSLEAQQKTSEAARTRAAYLKAWARADRPLRPTDL